MTPVEPSAFAAQLIARLEKLKRERDTMSSLEERLQQIQEVRVYVKREHGVLEEAVASRPAASSPGLSGLSPFPLRPMLLHLLKL